MQLESFLTYLKSEKRYSAHTLTSYKKDLSDFFCYLEEQYEVKADKEVTSIYIRSFMAQLIDGGVSKRSVNRKLSAIKSYFNFALKQNYVQQSPATAVSSLKIDQKLPVYVEQEPIGNFLAELPRTDFASYRDFLLVYLIYAFGLRRSELIKLKESDFDFTNKQLKVEGKGKKQRILPFGKQLSNHVKQYLLLKEELFGQTESLMVTDKGKTLYPNFVYRKVKLLLSVITTQQKKSPHILRHSFATHLLNQGADIMSIKELLGHESLQATQVYTHTNIEELKKIYKKSHPSS